MKTEHDCLIYLFLQTLAYIVIYIQKTNESFLTITNSYAL